MKGFARSDLAAECGTRENGAGIGVHSASAGGCEILRVQVKTPEAAARIGKPMGRYVTLDCGPICTLGEEEPVRCAVAVEVRDMAERMCKKRVGPGFSVLVAGLGNEGITPDALGPQTLRRLTVTRRRQGSAQSPCMPGGVCEISAISPGVFGQTGVKTVELLQGAVQVIHPDLVVAVDALAARSPERLGSTVQLCDSGISPGSGIGRGDKELTRDTLGVPVLALGVPTVIDSCTLVFDALQTAGYADLSEELRWQLERGRGYFVSPKEIDLLILRAATLLARALERAFFVEDTTI